MRSKTLPFLLSLAVLLAAAYCFAPGLRDSTARARTTYLAAQSDASLRQRNQSAFGRILGEVRATMADLMFVKANRYAHAGVGYNLSREAVAVAVDEEKQLKGCADVPTLIRSAGEDFRGFLGDLERQVKPYRESSDSHAHTSKAELIPWFRVMTLSNPYFIRGYRVGGMALVKEKKWREAFEFMNEGLEKNHDNPELFLLHQTIAFLHIRGRYASTYPWPESWFGNALDAAFKSYELGKKVRPPQGKTGQKHKGMIWTDTIKEDFAMGAHLAASLYHERALLAGKETGANLQEALRLTRELKALLPGFAPIEKLLRDIEKELDIPKNEGQ